ncbi:hypothetical protein ASF61_00030 [Duganella sp. Leaf126]|uniref:hypothetical protein n=1 Tax=Duganella sp. Leaf126 TaxID=1736266 RepID=UPI0006FC4677|nr:hypothetical protein [Duganella sp. Leaf126]KQQ47092.1 hypothetical protein ASF61_00030 [Duganella sp. Leaf126]
MKSILAVVGVVAALTGCATQQPYYSSARVVNDPYQWRTVSVTPSDRVYGQSSAPVYTTEELPPQPSSRVVYSEQPVTTTYITEPSTVIYQPAPVYYQPAPVYYPPAPSYYYPPVSIGLNFGFTHFSGGRGYYGGRGGWRR